jgi:diguanylate cyclase (GGDEF)-like protein
MAHQETSQTAEEQNPAGTAPPLPAADTHEEISRRMRAARERQISGSVATEQQDNPETDPDESDGRGLSNVILGNVKPEKPGLLRRAGRLAVSAGKGLVDIATHPFETAKSATRGAVGAVTETMRTAGEFFEFLDKVGPHDSFDARQTSPNAQLIGASRSIAAFRDAVLPKSTKDSQGFVEGVSQFMVGFAGTGKFGAFKSLASKGAAGFAASAAARGAVVDFTAFDPYEAQLAELAASTNVPGLRDLGEILSVTEDDSVFEGRFKRSVAGIIPGVAIDALLATARFVRAKRVVTNPAASAAEKEAAQAELESNGKVLADIDEGTHVTDEPAQVKQTPNGNYRIVEAEAPTTLRRRIADLIDPSRREEAERAVRDPMTGLPNQTAFEQTRARLDADPEAHVASFDVSNLKAINDTEGFGRGRADERLAEIATALREEAEARGIPARNVQRAGGDEFAVWGSDPGLLQELVDAVKERVQPLQVGEFQSHVRGGVGPNWLEAEGAAQAAKRVETGPKFRSASPEYAERWRAQAHATSVNEALAARTTATEVKLGAADTQRILELQKRIEEAAGDPEKIVTLLSEERFNFSYMDVPEKSLALMKAVGEIMGRVFDKAQGRPVITSDESIDRALRLAGMITRDEADDYFRNVATVLQNTDGNLLALNARHADLAGHVSKWAEVLEQRAASGIADPVAEAEARNALRAYIQFAADVAGSNSGVGRGLRSLQLRADERLKDLKFKGEAGAVETAASKELGPDIIAGMTAVQLRDVVRLFRLSKQPQILFNTLGHELSHAKVNRVAAFGRSMAEYFYNSVLSAPATWQAIFVANATVNGLEDAVRFMAGAVRRDPAMMREAADLLAGRMIYLKQSLKGMAMAAKAGHSIIDPRPVYKAIPGVAGEIVRTMGTRPISAVDEFWRVNSNLAYVRMMSLKAARRDAAARGLKGKSLDKFLASRVEADVKASLDPATGASRIPEARRFASVATFSSPLEPGSFGKTLEEAVQKHPLLVPVLPFVRTSVNVLDYSFGKLTPLGLLQRNIRETLAKGGPEAAHVATRMAVGSTIWSMAGLLAFSGDFTGRGPSDPQQRKLWLKNHEPYSVKMGDKWVSYRRAEPFATPMSFMADLSQILRDNATDVELQEGSTKAMYAVFASLVNSMTNKTYMSGLVDFMDAIGSGEGPALKRWIDQLQKPIVPNILQTANDDPYLRETQRMFDAVVNRVPGWSKSLPAKYSWDGEPIVLDPSRLERTLNPFPNKDGTPQVEDEILELHRAFVPPPTVVKFGELSINLHDRSYQNAKGGKLTPYERWMELIREQDLRGQVESIVSSASYQRAGDGTEVFAGGRRYKELQQRIDRVYSKAEKKMLAEYPELRRDLRGLSRARRASSRSDVKGETLLDRLGR